MAQLLRGAILVVVGIPDGDQGGVPGPLVRIEPRTRLGVIPGPVEFQNHLRVSDKICTVSHHEVSNPRAMFLSGCLTDRRGAVRTPGQRILRRIAFGSNSLTVARTEDRDDMPSLSELYGIRLNLRSVGTGEKVDRPVKEHPRSVKIVA